MKLKTHTKTHTGVKTGVDKEIALDGSTIELLLEGWRLKQTIAALKDRLDEINAKLIEAHGTGCTLVVCGVCRALLCSRRDIRITDAGRLKQVLGGRFDDLVSEQVVYRPTQKLLDMASDGDEILRNLIAACISINTIDSVLWRPE